MSFLGSVNSSSVWQPGPNILPRKSSHPLPKYL
jgi:hypothetical protein